MQGLLTDKEIALYKAFVTTVIQHQLQATKLLAQLNHTSLPALTPTGKR